METLLEVLLFVQYKWIKIAELCKCIGTKVNTAPFLVNFPKYSSVGVVLYILKKERKHVSKQAQIFALFVQKLFFFLCGSGQVPIKVVFQASFPCSRAAAFFFFFLFYLRAWREQRDFRFEVNRTIKYSLNCVYWICFSWNRFLLNVHVEYVQLFFPP